jgi:hypothetical protein
MMQKMKQTPPKGSQVKRAPAKGMKGAPPGKGMPPGMKGKGMGQMKGRAGR